MATEQAVFMFSLHEHGDNGKSWDKKSPEQSWIQWMAPEEWVLQRTLTPDKFIRVDPTEHEAEDEEEYEYEFVSFERFEARLREYLTGLPEDAVRVPIEKLKALMEAGGWRFVLGTVMEMEGNHNDSEFTVWLER